MGLSGQYEASSSEWVRNQVELYERTNGAEGNEIMGLPVIIVTNRGAKSGMIRKTPLMRVEHEGNYVAVASKGGAADHPVWYFNLLANPVCELRDGATLSDRRARLLEGDERSEWWQRAVAAFPNYADYQRNTEREIPLFILEPIG